MDETLLTHLESPRFVDAPTLLIAGSSERYTCESSAGIPAQWQRFVPHFGTVPGQVDKKAYGVGYNGDELGNFDYLCGVEVRDFSRLPKELACVRIPARRYAVFAHRGHVSMIRRTWNTIRTQWLPKSGYQRAVAPDFELYGEDFDPTTGTGTLEIWLPIKA